MVKLSVITINYNNAEGLKRTLESVVNQKNFEFEFIVVDGGSKDGSKEVIKNFESHLSYWVSESDSGIYDAMNKGIQKATGTYCLFLNSGDYLIEDTIFSKVFTLQANEDILYGEIIFDYGNEKKMNKRPEKLSDFHMYQDNIWHPASFIHTSLFARFGLYNLTYKIAADYDFFFKTIVVQKVTTRYIPFAISVYDTNGLSTLPNNYKQIKEERKKIHSSYLKKEEIDFFENLKKFKNRFLAKWLVNKPIANSAFTVLLRIYQKLR
jgi:glycosyltransferase involved in cell wall biosynthesis